MTSKRNVSASAVREWLTSDAGQDALRNADVTTVIGKRGRHKPEQVAVFHKANPRLRYDTASEAEKPTITVPVTTLDKAGRKRTEQRTLTTAEARAVLGHPKGKRGRFPKSDLSLALSASEADAVADQFA